MRIYLTPYFSLQGRALTSAIGSEQANPTLEESCSRYLGIIASYRLFLLAR